MTTRVLMVGAGGVARRHADVLSALQTPDGGATVVGIVDTMEPAARALAASYDCPAYTDLALALDASAPDAVYVCVPPFAHGEAERAALERGLPIFVEKPVGLDLRVVEDIAGRVEAAGVVTATGYHWRCMDVVSRAQELLAEAPALLAAGYWLDKRPPVSWWGQVDKSGGQVVEQLTHVLDVARLLLGEVVEVHAVGARVHTDTPGDDADDVDDATVATARFVSGAVATFSATSVLTKKFRAGLHTFGSGLTLELDETGLVVDRGEDREAHPLVEDPRVTVDREFVDAVCGRRPETRTPYAEAVASHRLASAIARSAREGRPVALDHGAGHQVMDPVS